jgi:hypothetical protein
MNLIIKRIALKVGDNLPIDGGFHLPNSLIAFFAWSANSIAAGKAFVARSSRRSLPDHDEPEPGIPYDLKNMKITNDEAANKSLFMRRFATCDYLNGVR